MKPFFTVVLFYSSSDADELWLIKDEQPLVTITVPENIIAWRKRDAE